MVARIRASEVTLPSLTGTFRSARINTRLPAKSRSAILITDIVSSSFLIKFKNLIRSDYTIFCVD